MEINDKKDLFRLPIQYSENVQLLDESIIRDLELVQLSCDSDADKPIYGHIYNTNNITSNAVKYYTTDVTYLTATQQLITAITSSPSERCEKYVICDVDSPDFCKQYEYINKSSILDSLFGANVHTQLNTHEMAQGLLGLSKMAGIAMSVGAFFITIIGVFMTMRRYHYISTSWEEYGKLFATILTRQTIARVGIGFGVPIWLLAIASVAFYAFTMYQNATVAVECDATIQNISTSLSEIKEQLSVTCSKWRLFCSAMDKVDAGVVESYSTFMEQTQMQITEATDIIHRIDILDVEHLQLFKSPVHTAKKVGAAKALFYQLNQRPSYVKCRQYLEGFHEYWCDMQALVEHIQDEKLHAVSWSKENAIKCTDMYYPAFMSTNYITNDVNVDRNWIITGPNASGKTTLMKTLFINVLLVQQIGYGCFGTMCLNPVTHFHSYLNIPDTSGRDSLFQAEARRGKEIIDCIEARPTDRHLCIFDELFSGTNPNDAIKGGTQVMKYLAKHQDYVTCMLSTHFTDICDNLTETDADIMRMKVDEETGKPCYQIEAGISTVQSGFQILRDMEYPEEVWNP